jgi:hypothetical protein
MKNNQKGFGALEALIIIVIVGLLGFGGWFIWNSNRTDDNKTSKQTQDKEDSESTDEERDKYLEIKEWGVHFTLNEDAKGSYYKVRQDGQYTYVDVFNSRFDTVENQNGVACKDTLLFVVARYSADDPRLEDSTNPKPETTIDGYGYAGTAANQAAPACSIVDDSTAGVEYDQDVLDTFTTYKDALTESFKSLESN